MATKPLTAEQKAANKLAKSVKDGAEKIADNAQSAATTESVTDAPATTEDKPATSTQTNEQKTAEPATTNESTNADKSVQTQPEQTGASQGAEQAGEAGAGVLESHVPTEDLGNFINPNATQGKTATKATESDLAGGVITNGIGASISEPGVYDKVEDTGARVKPIADQAYLDAYTRYIALYKELPNGDLDTNQLIHYNSQKENEMLEEANAEKSKQERAQEEFDNEHSVMAERDGVDGKEKKKFSKITWDLLKNSTDGWKLIPPAPPEVLALQNKAKDS